MNKKKIDWIITLVPIVMIVAISLFFFIMPEQSNDVLGSVRFFFGDTLGAFYIVFGLGVFLLTLYFAFSKYGNIVMQMKNQSILFLLGAV